MLLIGILLPVVSLGLFVCIFFHVNLTLRCNPVAAERVYVFQFVFCLPHLHGIIFLLSALMHHVSDRGDTWRSFLRGLKYGMCHLQTAWIQVKVILPGKALWKSRVRSGKYFTLYLAFRHFHTGEPICFSLDYLNLLNNVSPVALKSSARSF